MSKPSVEDLKARARRQEKAHNPDPKSKQRKAPIEGHSLSPAVAKDMRKVAAALNQVNASPPKEEPVDLGELPEEVKKRQEEEKARRQQEDVVYRYTAVDNPDVRAAIEARCTPMDFGDLLMTGRVGQEVPILPGKLTARFKSLKASETWWIEREMAQAFVSTFAANTWLGYAKLVFSLESVNGEFFPPIETAENSKDPNKDQFQVKFDRVFDYAEPVLELLMLNYMWFNDRVKELYRNDFDLLKNG